MQLLQFRGRTRKRFMGDLNLRRTFETGILPNSKKLWISMQHALLYRHFMKLLK